MICAGQGMRQSGGERFPGELIHVLHTGRLMVGHRLPGGQEGKQD